MNAHGNGRMLIDDVVEERLKDVAAAKRVQEGKVREVCPNILGPIY